MAKFKPMTLAEELAPRKTGYDVLVENKRNNLDWVEQIFKEDPNTPLEKACEEVGCSLRTMNRYIAELRRSGKMVAVYDQNQAREDGIQALRKLLKDEPALTVKQRCTRLRIKERTYRRYLAEIHRRYS